MINWQNGTTPINETNMNKLVQEDMITDAYSSLQTYAVGDYCIYENTLYKCTTAISTAEAWNSAHWTAVTVTDEIKENAVAISSTQPSTEEKIWIKKGKNLIKNDLTGSYTKNGITFTINNDKSITVNGTATADASINLFDGNLNLSKGTYRLSGCPAGGSSTKYRIGINPKANNYFDTGSGAIITLDSDTSGISMWIIVYSGQTVNNLTFRPMLQQGSTASTYEAYINKEILVKNENNVFEKFYDENDNNQGKYALVEQRIGTWIDGKPLYRKVIQTTTPTVTTNGTSAWQQVAIQNVKFGRVTDCQMLSNVANGTLLSPITRSTLAAGLNQFITVSFVNNTSNNTGVFQIESSSTTYNNRTVYAVIEYTKTTD